MMAAEKIAGSDSPRLSALLAGLAPVRAEDDVVVLGVTMDSRRVRHGDVFFACSGLKVNGQEFIADAVREGAVAVVYETPWERLPVLPMKVPLIGVPNLAQKLGVIAERFFHHPSRSLHVVGVTGTNGKTSTTHFIAHSLSLPNRTACGLIGTLGSGLYGNLNPAVYTTPDPISLHAMLAEMRDAGAQDVAMEVSSHGLVQGRAAGVEFDTAVFTNLTRDHLDYHGDMASYAAAKRRLFMCPTLQHAVVNLDDVEGPRIIAALAADVEAIGFTLNGGGGTSVTGRKLRLLRGALRRCDLSGIELAVSGDFGEGVLSSRLIGEFNASNLLAALGALLAKSLRLDDALARLASARPVPGRLEGFGGAPGEPLVVVDYAHTPDALEKVLRTLRPIARGKLWCVFGCGGNRDRGKRPQMGAIAERCADHVIITDDNPRGEDPSAIVAEILAGIGDTARVEVIHARAEAIAYAVGRAAAGDVVLIAGKGHEDYQEVRGQRRRFSDREQVSLLFGPRSDAS